jgi:hypothetical protein
MVSCGQIGHKAREFSVDDVHQSTNSESSGRGPKNARAYPGGDEQGNQVVLNWGQN